MSLSGGGLLKEGDIGIDPESRDRRVVVVGSE